MNLNSWYCECLFENPELLVVLGLCGSELCCVSALESWSWRTGRVDCSRSSERGWLWMVRTLCGPDVACWTCVFLCVFRPPEGGVAAGRGTSDPRGDVRSGGAERLSGVSARGTETAVPTGGPGPGAGHDDPWIGAQLDLKLVWAPKVPMPLTCSCLPYERISCLKRCFDVSVEQTAFNWNWHVNKRSFELVSAPSFTQCRHFSNRLQCRNTSCLLTLKTTTVCLHQTLFLYKTLCPEL